jgi:hypothetical protein
VNATRGEPTLPWSQSDARTSALMLLVGAILLGWAWFEASGTARLSSQNGWLAMSVFGTLIVGFAGSSWIWAGRRNVRERRSAVADALAATFVPAAASGTSSSASGLVTIKGSARYHRADCQLVQGKRVQRLAAGATGERRRCEMCQP